MAEHTRINFREIKDNIFTIHPENIDQDVLDGDNSIDPIVTVYTVFGKHDAVDENGMPLLYDTVYERSTGPDRNIKAETLPEACAKLSFNGKRYRYYIKIDNRGHMYDPHGAYEEIWTKQRKHASGEPIWKFREVNNRIFELYTSFLKTKNKSWLRNAERANQ